MKIKTIFLCSFILFLQSYLSFAQIASPLDDGRIIDVPVIFHIVYSNNKYSVSEDKPHSNENIPDEAIIRELEDLKLDFLMQNDQSFIVEEFKDIVGNPNVRFHLADTLLQKNGSKGIKRIFHPTGLKDMSKVSPLIKKDQYLNIYIGNKGNFTNINGDRVTLSFSQIGEGTRVLTHEVGHYFGLYHTWAKIGSCSKLKNFFAKKDDGIDDTPPQKLCSDLSRKSCPPKNRAVNRKEKANWNNFMDYSACRAMFTEKQAIQMRNNVISKRLNIFESSTL